MGLDSVEFILAIEDEFDLRIPDGDAERLGTVGLLCDYLVQAKGGACTWDAAFERVQRILVDMELAGARRIDADTHFVNDLRLD